MFLQVHLLESDLDRKTQSLKEAEGRLADLEREYEGYKVLYWNGIYGIPEVPWGLECQIL